jgi:hypothetical protein
MNYNGSHGSIPGFSLPSNTEQISTPNAWIAARKSVDKQTGTPRLLAEATNSRRMMALWYGDPNGIEKRRFCGY